MLEVDAVIGGEGGSGGVIWPAMHPCRDSFSGMALILEMMALRLDWEDSWVLIRASNTEPVIRIFGEALTQEKANQLVNQFIEEI